MTPAQLKKARHSLGLSAGRFAAVFGVASERTVRGWEAGERNGRKTDVPRPVELLVQLALEFEDVRRRLGI